MPYSIFFTQQGHAIHGTYHKSIGRPASHGCVRLSVANAATLFALVKQQGIKQTKVVLVGEIPDNVAVGAVVAEDSPYTDAPRHRRTAHYGESPGYYRGYYPVRRYYGGFFPFGW